MAAHPDPARVPRAHWARRVRTALAGRCPRCERGALFRSRFRLVERCEACGLLFRREDGAMTGQMYLSAAVTEVVAAIVVAVTFLATDWGPGLSIAVGLPLVVGFSYWFLPKAMALWVAIEFLTDVANREPWVDEEA